MTNPDWHGAFPDLATAPVISIPEVRDYGRINPDLVELLDAGHRLVRLVGAERQRLLVSRLCGNWEAVVLVEGDAGPELAAELDAPHLLVVCLGSAADGAGLGMRGGRLLIRGEAGDALGYGQAGGTILVEGPSGHRAGLNRRDGWLILRGPTGRLLAERQSGGNLVLLDGPVGPHPGRGMIGGRLLGPAALPAPFAAQDQETADAMRAAIGPMLPWLSGDLRQRVEAF